MIWRKILSKIEKEDLWVMIYTNIMSFLGLLYIGFMIDGVNFYINYFIMGWIALFFIIILIGANNGFEMEINGKLKIISGTRFSIPLQLIFLSIFLLVYFIPTFIPLWLLIILLIIFTEVLFWFDKQKISKHQSKFWFTVIKKLEALFEALVVLSILNTIRIFIKSVIYLFHKILNITIPWKIIFTWLGYIGIVVLSIALLYLYVKINSVKYNNKKYIKKAKQKNKKRS